MAQQPNPSRKAGVKTKITSQPMKAYTAAISRVQTRYRSPTSREVLRMPKVVFSNLASRGKA